MELRLFLKNGGQEKRMVEELHWVSSRTGAAFAEVLLPEGTAEMGQRVRLSENGTPFFDGFVFQAEESEKGTELLCYDRVKYLLYKDTKVFQNRTAGQIVEEILKERQLPIGKVAATGYTIPSLVMEGRPLLEMIRKGISETEAAIGEGFVFFDDCGALSLKKTADNASGVLLSGENQILSLTKSRDIDGDSYNRFKLWQEDGRSGFRRVTVSDRTEEQKNWGMLQYFERVDSKLSSTQVKERIRALEQAKCRVRQQVLLEALTDVRCRGGKTVLLRDGGSVGRFLIEEAQMRFANGAGKMALKLRKEQK